MYRSEVLNLKLLSFYNFVIFVGVADSAETVGKLVTV